MKALTYRIKIEPHNNADSLEIAKVGDFCSIVRKGQYKTGDLVGYIPTGYIVPQSILTELGLVDKLAGPNKDRVKAIRLRGVLSEGICYPAKPHWTEDMDITDELGLVKWVPEIPIHMAGEIYALESHECVKYDIDNIKAHPDWFVEGEEVYITEKIHGTWCMVGCLYNPNPLHHMDRFIVSSKGLSNRNLGLKYDLNNLYWRIAQEQWVLELAKTYSDLHKADVFIVGEIFGKGVQDLTYDVDKQSFRVFDIKLGNRWESAWLLYDVKGAINLHMKAYGIQTVPLLYTGPFNKQTLESCTEGNTTIGNHIREGCVIRPAWERRDSKGERVIAKSINPAYLLREGGTEYN